MIDAGEFDDARYRANPVDRCYFCKTNLYARIRRATADPIASGTNLDDLGDYRPGLRAAAERGVVHPFVEAGIDKAAICALAPDLGLADLGGCRRSPACPAASRPASRSTRPTSRSSTASNRGSPHRSGPKPSCAAA